MNEYPFAPRLYSCTVLRLVIMPVIKKNCNRWMHFLNPRSLVTACIYTHPHYSPTHWSAIPSCQHTCMHPHCIHYERSNETLQHIYFSYNWNCSLFSHSACQLQMNLGQYFLSTHFFLFFLFFFVCSTPLFFAWKFIYSNIGIMPNFPFSFYRDTKCVVL